MLLCAIKNWLSERERKRFEIGDQGFYFMNRHLIIHFVESWKLRELTKENFKGRGQMFMLTNKLCVSCLFWCTQHLWTCSIQLDILLSRSLLFLAPFTREQFMESLGEGLIFFFFNKQCSLYKRFSKVRWAYKLVQVKEVDRNPRE